MKLIEGLDDVNHPQLDRVLERCDFVQVTKEEDPERWLALRAKGLGGSDTGSILDLNPYKSQLKLWLQKTGQIPDDDLSDKESVYWGVVLEDIVAAEFAKRTGYTVINPLGTFIHREITQLRANPDRLYITPEGELGVLECKTADSRLLPYWEDDQTPSWYEAQDAHYCATLGLVHSRVAVLIGGNNFQMRDPELTPDVIEDIADQELTWWARHVVGGEAPRIDGSASTTDAIRARWPEAAGSTTVSAHALDLVLTYRRLGTTVKLFEEQKKEIGNQLRAVLEDKASGLWDGTTIFSHKAPKPKEVIDWEAVAARAALGLGVPVGDIVIEADRSIVQHGKRLHVSTSKDALAALDEYQTKIEQAAAEAA